VANYQGLAKIRKNPRFSVDSKSLHAKNCIVRRGKATVASDATGPSLDSPYLSHGLGPADAATPPLHDSTRRSRFKAARGYFHLNSTYFHLFPLPGPRVDPMHPTAFRAKIVKVSPENPASPPDISPGNASVLGANELAGSARCAAGRRSAASLPPANDAWAHLDTTTNGWMKPLTLTLSPLHGPRELSNRMVVVSRCARGPAGLASV
jgi:hypothetical protein